MIGSCVRFWVSGHTAGGRVLRKNLDLSILGKDIYVNIYASNKRNFVALYDTFVHFLYTSSMYKNRMAII